MKNKEAKSIFSSLENYSSIPPPELWDKIEAQLDKPKKKNRAIIWWSIAASLVVGLSVPTVLYFNANQGNDLELNVESNANGVVLQKESTEKNINTRNENSNQNGNDNLNGKKNKNDNLNSNEVATASVSNTSSNTKEALKSKNLNQWRKNGKIQIAENGSQSNGVVSNQNSTSVVSIFELAIDKSAQVGNSNPNKNAIVSNQNNTISEENKNKTVAENTSSKSESVIDKSVQVNQFNAGNKALTSNQNNEVSGLSSNKAITENTSSKDSLSKIKSEVEQLEKALVQSDKDKTKKKEIPESVDKWSLQIFAGVMSSQNYTNEKALGNTVASKQSSGYGVKTNYKLNKKWAVSSGFKINELGQKIAGVSYYDTQMMYSAAAFPIINDKIVTNSSGNYQLVSISKEDKYLFSSNSKSASGLEKGDVTQNLRYFEMPLEVSYSLLNKKKANISMNTGGFVGKLISNDISLNGSSIGENKNVNEYVYGTLLTSTLQYELFKKTNFFIEPGMNYYINPLENQSFNQFQWMFNFGLNVSF